ncbi:LysM peptidoglycan-binding domain-containing protein [Rudaeicoccus suwonensis]|uniref:LysM domain-containing protein n=1 Tax=Rudaeicoccus suwonensis TaxID=657409 RepID=A0A561E975_9MICO|nr:LysM domain-containing protein [Rudaeicoccus suwonensis]TWE12161.1 LysM domain-containing protein [Rudaeicoccus suwonensis]
MQQPPIGWAHRLRAAMLGAVLLVVALIAAGLAAAQARTEYDRLSERLTTGSTEAALLSLWAALAVALLWAATVVAVAMASVARNGNGIDPSGAGHTDGPTMPGHARTSGAAMWTVGVLLTLTSLTTGTSTASASSVGPAMTVATSTAASPDTIPGTASTTTAMPQISDEGSIPAPSFDRSPTSRDDAPVASVGGSTSSAESTAAASPSADQPGCDIPVPSWLPQNPGRTSQLAEDSASLITGCGATDDSGTVVVRRGDTLWSIAAAHLGPAADATTIAGEWPRWYAANRDLIGDDPDVLLVGQQLRAPDLVLEGTK